MEPPAEQRPGPVKWKPIKLEPGQPKLALIGKHRRGPLGRRPDAQRHDREHDQYLSDQKLRRRHDVPAHRHRAGISEEIGYQGEWL